MENRRVKWVGTWAASQQLVEPGNMPPSPGFADSTLRQVVHVTLGGKQLRVGFSNEFGVIPLKLMAAQVAVSAGGGKIRPETSRVLTFQGKPSVSIEPGTRILSDSFAFDLAPLSDLAVTMYLRQDSPKITGHPGSRCTSYLQAGDQMASVDLSGAVRVDHWYFLSGVDVVAMSRDAAVVVTLGDSITDGRNSTTNGNGRWPDYLARRLQAERRTAHVGVINAGIGGNRILNDGLGPSALARLERDVLDQPGVRWLIVLEGINDLGTRSASAQDLIVAYKQIIARARAKKIRVYGMTILPCGQSFYFTPELEAARQTINDWMRTSGAFDAVIDMDAMIRDPQQPTRLAVVADSDDHLHPTERGYKFMAEALDLKLFL